MISFVENHIMNIKIINIHSNIINRGMTMNYLRIYFNIISKAKTEKRTYEKLKYEKHHIIPKSLYEFDYAREILSVFNIKTKYGKDNTILLTYKEHYLSHVLLVKIFKNNKNCYEKMLYAFNFMSCRGNSGKYASLKLEYITMMRENHTGKPSGAKGKKWSKERRELGQQHLKGKTYEEIYGKIKGKEMREKRRAGLLGKTRSPEVIEKLKNREFSQEWREKISKSKKGKKRTDEVKRKISLFMNSDKNPKVDRRIFMFQNIITQEILVCRKIDMVKNYNCSYTLLNKLINGKTKIHKNWSFIKEIL